MEQITHSEKETREVAEAFARRLKGGEVLALNGDLGAGKTAFVKGLAKGLGIRKAITSPTFVLMKVYPVKSGTIRHFVHVDAYRLKGGASLRAIGLADYLGDPTAVVVIEWAERVRDILTKDALMLSFEHRQGDERQLNIA